jgi:hypothetical protein
MRLHRLLRVYGITATIFGLSAFLAAASASESESGQPQFQPMQRDDTNIHFKASHTAKIRTAPVSTETTATLQPDGSVVLRCNEVHDHAQEPLPSVEKSQ